MLEQILNAIDTLGYIADTPGAYTRGALSGRLGERRSGREMLTDWGVTSANDESRWELGDILGAIAEMVADPTNLVGAGVLGKTAKAAKGAKARNAVAAAKNLESDRAVAPAMKRLGYTPPLHEAVISEDMINEAVNKMIDGEQQLAPYHRRGLESLLGNKEGWLDDTTPSEFINKMNRSIKGRRNSFQRASGVKALKKKATEEHRVKATEAIKNGAVPENAAFTVEHRVWEGPTERHNVIADDPIKAMLAGMIESKQRLWPGNELRVFPSSIGVKLDPEMTGGWTDIIEGALTQNPVRYQPLEEIPSLQPILAALAGYNTAMLPERAN